MWHNHYFLEPSQFFIRKKEHPCSVSSAESLPYASLLGYYRYRSYKLCKGSITNVFQKGFIDTFSTGYKSAPHEILTVIIIFK